MMTIIAMTLGLLIVAGLAFGIALAGAAERLGVIVTEPKCDELDAYVADLIEHRRFEARGGTGGVT